MAGEPGGIAASVRRKLAEGLSRDEIVTGLVAGGLSKLSAERFVDREISSQLPPLEPLIPSPAPAEPLEETVQPDAAQAAEPAAEPAGTMYEGPGTMYEGPPVGVPDQIDKFLAKSQDDSAEADAKQDLRIGSYVTTAGIALTLISTFFPGRGVLFYGAVLYGVFRFIRGLVRYSKLDRPMPWARVAALAAIPILSFPVLFIAIGVLKIQTDMSAYRESFDDGSEAARAIRRQAGDAYERRQRRNDQNVDELVERLQRNGLQCDAASELGRTQSSRAVDPLIQYLQMNRVDNSTQVCIVNALVELGEIATAIGYYRHWINGLDRYLWRQGVVGLGKIGPDAAPEAIPLVAYLVESNVEGDRYLAAQTLAQLGPDAEELLEVLAEDREQSVRYTASEALKAIRDEQKEQ
jgi:hypothetical protein